MKVGTVIRSNQKGQIVIPKEYRKALGIKSNSSLNVILRGKSIYLYPILEVVTSAESENSYVKILEKTRGKWKKSDWEIAEKEKRKIELSASRQRKKAW